MDAFRDHHCVVIVGQVLAQDHELVAAEAGNRVSWTQRGAQPLCQRDEQVVSYAVTKAVVDDLEVVEVAEQDGNEAVAAARPRQREL